MRNGLIAAMVGAALAGCGASGTLDAPSGAAVPAQPAPYPRDVTLPEVRMGSDTNQLAMVLAARLEQAGRSLPSLRLSISYPGPTPRSYEVARDGQGRPLKIERVAAAECKPGARCSEAIRIELPDAELRQAQASGYRLKVMAKKGPEIEIGIPGGQISALYQSLDAGAGRPAASRKGT